MNLKDITTVLVSITKFIGKHSMLFVSVVLCLMLFVFINNLSSTFDTFTKNYENGTTINLDENTSAQELSKLLYRNRYVNNNIDADFAADTIVARLKRERFKYLYQLQKRGYGTIPMLQAESFGVFNERVKNSNERIGLSALSNVNNVSDATNLGQGSGSITITIKTTGNEDVSNTIVRLKTYYYDNDTIREEIAGFAKTDSTGRAIFIGLNKNNGYSVLPIKKGFEYGNPKGVAYGKFKKDAYSYTFTQMEHHIQMIGNYTLKEIKDDGALTIRTPEEYKKSVIGWFLSVLLAWWLVFFIFRHKQYFKQSLFAAATFLTGFCVIIMFSIQNPLTEEMRGIDMAEGVLLGLLSILLLQLVDFIKLYQQRYNIAWLKLQLSKQIPLYEKIWNVFLFIAELPFGILQAFQIDNPKLKISKFCDKLPKGTGWLVLALLLTALLFPFGQSIGGAKVNYVINGFIFQPSEIAKYLILLFTACFFTQNADLIIKYSRPLREENLNMVKQNPSWDRARNAMLKPILGKLQSKVATLWITLGLVILMLLYLGLGDMGPALVLCVSFILLYSLVKSKVNLDNLSEADKWNRIFTCDFAMLLYGVISFAVFTWLASTIGYSWLGALLWFVCWIVFGLLRHRQFFETAIIMNLLICVFIFLGQVPQKQGLQNDIVERFAERTNMCVNTWGKLDVEHHGANAQAVSNTQVANGLWSLATGGLTGQGLGKGNPSLTPAFHTDMILSSIGEQTGWIGLLLVVFALFVIIINLIRIGYRAGHPFAFYFCTGVAITIGVQFFIIALGSTGIIPLTGITVPYLSYGRVSMILNLFALGIALSFIKNIKVISKNSNIEKIEKRNVGDYSYPSAIISMTFGTLALFTLGVWLHYCFWDRNGTLVHPAFTYNQQGVPIIEYNPRISVLTKEMCAGNIYDKNGILLATSDNGAIIDSINIGKYVNCGLDSSHIRDISKSHLKRYYPFEEQLFFMLGDINNGLFFTYDKNNPIGYMAEVQHLSYLRDYSNTHFDSKGNPIDTVRLHVKPFSKNRFIGNIDTTYRYVVRDNKELLPYLKEGIYGSSLYKHNKKVREGKYDLHLTIDAKLQSALQNQLSDYVSSSELKDNNLLRISVVVLDAKNGDLLSSACYPLPDYKRLWDEYAMGHKSYSDHYHKNSDWTAYTDRDLGLTYQTNPGSTAKVMSAMAGLQKIGMDACEKEYFIYEKEIIENGKVKEPTEWVTMKKAIVESSNCYFINLVNDKDLYWNLDSIYEATGIRIKTTTPYYLTYNIDNGIQNTFREHIETTRQIAISKYHSYKAGGEHKKMNDGDWMWAWGQGTLDASPLNMARVVSAVINNGEMPFTQYVLAKNDHTKKIREEGCVRLLTSDVSNILKKYMKEEAQRQQTRNKTILPDFVGGKTGTPERTLKIRDVTFYSRKQQKEVTQTITDKPNDGWYIFFIEGNNKSNPLAVALRMERCSGSGQAVRLSKYLINNSLSSYINGQH